MALSRKLLSQIAVLKATHHELAVDIIYMGQGRNILKFLNSGQSKPNTQYIEVEVNKYISINKKQDKSINPNNVS